MTNGETIKEIKELLSENGAIKTTTALRLTLDISSQIYDKLELQERRMRDLEERLKAVEDASIVLWIQRNPKLSIFFVTLYIVLSASVNFEDVIAKAMGVK